MTIHSHFDVLVVGTPCIDMVFSGMPHWPVPGQELYVSDFGISVGACFNTAATLSRLGLHVALLSELGNDFFSRYILEEVAKAGISRELLVLREYPLYSLSICLAHDGERGFVSYVSKSRAATSQAASASSVEVPGARPAALSAPELHYLLDGRAFDATFLYAHPAALRLLDIVDRRRTRVFFDTGWHADTLMDERMFAILRRGECAMPNQIEATCMTRTETAEEAARVLSTVLPTAIVKLGARGVVACQRGALTYCPAFPVAEVVDTTGAGDAFNAGYIYGMLKGYSLPEALRCGTICGSLSTTALTGTAAVPTAAELERLRLNMA